ncbi:2-oxoacid:acceptor oxidoreductase family protein [Candidatus Magnetobacterium casense]|uniref:2-oxoacid:acceptor oxidoreductase family protein n=1 Tax=Candidatus Magnetobacterium casense TaxID=1455061 RepID=A0ABS6RY57_9BACT|nr:2-oxoacid:acceptor oxidoreductase family protein [Candidatus Magnetobacterium casensis]MBV6341582.1 2-oxoacid:acceptor oxidoreductase family protein [Candidatus Magnetobacterium casensis]
MEKKVLIGGSGGQGILFMGKVMAYAAMIEGKEVTWYPSYGAEMRCGTANCSVVISEEAIGPPVITWIDILIAFTEASSRKFAPRLQKDGILFYDSSLMTIDNSIEVDMCGIEANYIASGLGDTRIANMVMLGAVAAITGLFTQDVLFAALENNQPRSKEQAMSVNKDALLRGFKIGEVQKSNHS